MPMGFKNIFKKQPAAAASCDNAAPAPVHCDGETNGSKSPMLDSSSTGSKSLEAMSPVLVPSAATSSRHPSLASLRSQTPEISRQNSNSSSSTTGSFSGAPSSSANDSIAHVGSSSHGAQNLSRYQVHPGGKHVHVLKNTRRQEKLGRMLREMMNPGSKVGNDAVSAVPDFLKNAGDKPDGNEGRLTLMHGLVNRLQKGEVEVGRVTGASYQPKRLPSGPLPAGREIQETTAKSLAEKYGRCQEVIGRGSYGIVRVAHKNGLNGRENLYAVKEFRKRSTENEHTYEDRLMAEFCISSSLHHTNIIHTFDLMRDMHGTCCQIMEYCSGGDLYSLILSSGTGLTDGEADCFFKQILRGVVYMHSMGVAHCDLKPENILLTQNGVCKITDFGNGECFRMAWEKEVHYSRGVFGSGPYIAPEEFRGKSFDPRAVDIWALGIVYMVMRTGSYLWRKAVSDEDDNYAKYLRDRKTARGYSPVEKLSPSKCVYVIYSILDPVPSRRITGKQVLNSEWGRSIRVCDVAEPEPKARCKHNTSTVTTIETSHTVGSNPSKLQRQLSQVQLSEGLSQVQHA